MASPPIRALLALTVLAVLALRCGAAEDVRDTARGVSDKVRKSVVTVRVVIKLKISAGGQSQDQEQKVETLGTIIDPSGLTVVSASAVDTSSTISALLKKMGNQVDISSEVKDTALLLDDGTEVESDIVLKDADLDLAFVRPRDPKLTLEAVELKAAKAPARPLDQVFAVSRLGKVASRSITLALGDIRACVKGPQPYYVADDAVSADVGALAFAADGSPLGVFVTKRSAEGDDGGGMLAMLSLMTRHADPSAVVIIRPSQAVLELIPQAKQAVAPAKSDEAKDAPAKDAFAADPAPEKDAPAPKDAAPAKKDAAPAKDSAPAKDAAPAKGAAPAKK